MAIVARKPQQIIGCKDAHSDFIASFIMVRLDRVNKLLPLVSNLFHSPPKPPAFPVVPLRGDERLFLCGRRSSQSSRLTVARLTETACRASKPVCSSAKVASGCSLFCFASHCQCFGSNTFFSRLPVTATAAKNRFDVSAAASF